MTTHLKKEDGFTLIELLVVVIIIGLLAAVAIPAFLGFQANAREASVESDVRNGASKIVAQVHEEGGLPADSSGLTASNGNTLTLAADGSDDNFSLIGTNTDGFAYTYQSRFGTFEEARADSGGGSSGGGSVALITEFDTLSSGWGHYRTCVYDGGGFAVQSKNAHGVPCAQSLTIPSNFQLSENLQDDGEMRTCRYFSGDAAEYNSFESGQIGLIQIQSYQASGTTCAATPAI